MAVVVRSHPGALVLSQDTAFDRDYGRNPYAGYDEADSEPFLLDEQSDPRLPPKERVLAVRRGRDAVVVPFAVAERKGALSFEAFGRRLVALWAPGVASALDADRIEDSRDIGTAAICEQPASGPLEADPGDPARFTGADGTVWDISGHGVSGAGEGKRLERVAHDQQFWFAFAAFLTGDVRIVD